MPSTAGRVRMPANNRVHNSAALPDKDENKNSVPDKKSNSEEPETENAYASYQGLLAVARITGSNADEAPGSCKKCGRVGHLSFQCRNFLSMKDVKKENDPQAIEADIMSELGKLKGHSRKGNGKTLMESSEESDDDDSESSDSDADSEFERIIAERQGKKVKKQKPMKRDENSDFDEEDTDSKRKKMRGRSKKRSGRRGTEDSDDPNEVRRKRHKEKRRKKDESTDDDEKHRHRSRESAKEKRSKLVFRKGKLKKSTQTTELEPQVIEADIMSELGKLKGHSRKGNGKTLMESSEESDDDDSESSDSDANSEFERIIAEMQEKKVKKQKPMKRDENSNFDEEDTDSERKKMRGKSKKRSGRRGAEDSDDPNDVRRKRQKEKQRKTDESTDDDASHRSRESAKEKRSKLVFRKGKLKKSTQTIELEPPSQWPSPFFINADSLERYKNNFQFKPLILCRKVEFSELYSFNLVKPLKAIGLYELFNFDGPYFETPIRLFYANLKQTHQPLKISSYLYGKHIEITTRSLNSILECDFNNSSEKYYEAAKDPNFLGTEDGTNFLRMIVKDPSGHLLMKPKARDLNVRARLLHHMITYNLLPRDGHRDHISGMDLYVLYKIYREEPFNIGYIILKKMIQVLNNSSKSLPFNLLLLKIFKSNGVQIPRIETRLPLKKTDTYTTSSLARMRIAVNDEGEWFFKGDQGGSRRVGPSPMDVDVEDDHEQAQTPEHHFDIPRGSSSSFEERFTNLESSVASLSMEVRSLQNLIITRFDQIDVELRRLFIKLHQHIKDL